MQNTILEMKNIVKEFNRNKVLKGVSLQVDKGEIVSLVGENGAGKSTLMNILFGMAGIVNTGGYEGQIIWEGQPVQMVSPGQAMNLGIGMVHQEFMLLPSYTVTENVKLKYKTQCGQPPGGQQHEHPGPPAYEVGHKGGPG